MTALKWNKLIGQQRIKNVLDSAFVNKTLGHAYLFCGEAGTGKFAAALDLAMALLCQREESRPCGVCLACKKTASYSHPDFHVIMPVLLQAEHKKESSLNEQGWQFVASCAKSRIEDPYKLPEHGGIPDIPVDWMREAIQAVQRGGAEGGYNVTIMDGVESMKKETANAILKTLEEPPPGTIIIALTNRINYVLPTIISRCQVLRFSYLTPETINAELCRRFNVDSGDPRVELAAAGGSLGAAITEFENPETEWFEAAASIWNSCMAQDWQAVSVRVDSLGGGAEGYLACHKIFKSLLRLLRTAFLRKFSAPVNYFKSNIKMPCQIELPETVTPYDAEKFIRLCQEAMRALESRGNSGLVLVNFLCSLMEILNGKKQQTC
ncbi:MAG: hypothetical protein LBI42_06145 [Chitinispirillales bacterium]|jgi:DNA polymerase III delta' subunit|nr:hypothetical protein [Chitinispirillales bacterium]